MNDLQRRLVDLYAAGPIEEVHESMSYVQLCTEYKGDRIFNTEREMIENLRMDIDRRLGSQESYRDQIDLSLRFLRRLKQEKQKICRELILLSYGKHWDDRQRSYFEGKSILVMQASDYFLSFTNRNPNKPNLNYINRNHEFFIKHTLGSKVYGSANLSESNLLAEAVNYILRNEGLEGFYYPRHEENNESIEKKLRGECVRALAFVQLVQREMFRFYEGSRNWCHYEYTVARDGGVDRIKFVQIDEKILKDDVAADFDPWFLEFVGRDSIKLTLTRWFRPNLIEEARRKISEELTKQIRDSGDRIYLEIPN